MSKGDMSKDCGERREKIKQARREYRYESQRGEREVSKKQFRR